MSVAWDRNTDSQTAGYRLYYGTASGSYQWSVDVGNQVTAPLTLSAGSVYYMTVRGYNASYQYGPASNEASINLSTPTPTPPTAQIQASMQSANTALVSWQTTNATAASINGNAVALSGSTTVTVNASTTFTLTATSSTGTTARATATVTPTTAPAPTARIQASMQSANTALVSWQTTNATAASINGNAVALNGSTTVTVNTSTTFTLTATSSTGTTARATATVTPTTAPAPTARIQASMQSANTALVSWQTTNATAASINGNAVALNGSTTVTVNTSTTFTLTATSSTGTTARASATVTPTPAAAPTARIQASMQSANTALVSWQTTNATAASINGAAVALNGSTTVTVNTSTTFTLTATGAGGATARANATVSPTTSTSGAPVAATNMAATVVGSRATLSWRPGTGGGTPTEYLVYVSTTSWGSNVIYARSVGNVLTVSGDLPNGRYYARVRARNAAGTSTSSNQVEFIVGRTLTAPTGFVVTWSGSRATLTWRASAADSLEDTPTGYVLEAGTNPGLSDVAAVQVGNVTSFSTDITAGTYYVRVRAVNELGGSHSTADIALVAPGAPAAPTALSESGAGGTVGLRWTAPGGGAAPVGYIVEAGSEPGLSDLAKVQVANITEFSTEAPPGIYYVRVRAVNDRGVGPASNEILVQR